MIWFMVCLFLQITFAEEIGLMEISSGSWQTGYEASALIQVRDEATLKMD